MALLEVRNLSVKYKSPKGEGYAVNDISFQIEKGDIVGLVGESGCGKSTLAWSIIQLLPTAAEIAGGKILLNDKNLLDLGPRDMAVSIRGKEIAVIPQNPQGSFNPTFQIATQITDVLRYNRKALAFRRQAGAEIGNNQGKNNFRQIACEWLERVGIPDAQKRMADYPHQFSGGMKQRVMIAMAFITNPKLLIADEPTTALDVTLEAQILELLKKTIDQFKTSTIYITHDLGVVSKLCDLVMIMYAGKIVEIAKRDELFTAPLHSYTQALLKCIPGRSDKGNDLSTIPGTVPNIFELPNGCAFHPRCQVVMNICKREEPELKQVASMHSVKCFKA